MKTPLPGGLKSRREFISSRRRQEAYFHEGLLIRKIEESSRGYLLKAKSKNNFQEDLLTRRIEESPGNYLPKAYQENLFRENWLAVSITRLPRSYLRETTSRRIYLLLAVSTMLTK